MTTEALLAAIAAIVVPTAAAIVAAMRAGESHRAVQELHIQVNSRLTELLAATAASNRAEGVLEGKREGKTDEGK